MSDILNDLRNADIRGSAPPQNWTTRAADEIHKLRQELEAVRGVCNSSPELNMSNYNVEEVEKLNNAMIELYGILNQIPPPTDKQNGEECAHDYGVDEAGDIVRCQICGAPRALIEDGGA